MRILTLFMAVVCLCSAQTLTLTGPATVMAGQSATATLSVSGTAGTNLAAFQWTIVAPSGTGVAGASIATTGANKALTLSVYCGTTSGTCLIVNSVIAAMSDGPLAAITITTSASAAPGTYTIPLSGIVAASTTGTQLPMTNGSPFTIRIVGHCDMDGNGTVNVADVQEVINQALGIQACALTTGCTVVQVQAVIIAALGGACIL